MEVCEEFVMQVFMVLEYTLFIHQLNFANQLNCSQIGKGCIKYNHKTYNYLNQTL
jgi:hypothetical protein